MRTFQEHCTNRQILGEGAVVPLHAVKHIIVTFQYIIQQL